MQLMSFFGHGYTCLVWDGFQLLKYKFLNSRVTNLKQWIFAVWVSVCTRPRPPPPFPRGTFLINDCSQWYLPLSVYFPFFSWLTISSVREVTTQKLSSLGQPNLALLVEKQHFRKINGCLMLYHLSWEALWEAQTSVLLVTFLPPKCLPTLTHAKNRTITAKCCYFGCTSECLTQRCYCMTAASLPQTYVQSYHVPWEITKQLM